jgi:WD40 repeat protein
MPAVENDHPAPELLPAFALGQLDAEVAGSIERHVAACDSCCQALLEVSDDALVARLRHSAIGAAALPSSEGATLAASAPGMGTAETPAALPAELATHPRYQVEALLGIGGMGAVYRAYHRVMERPVALKVINQTLTNKPAMVERFVREGKAAARLSHPNIVTALDADQAGATHFLVMEYVEGIDLARLVKEQGALPVDRACEYVRQAALGLQHAFEHGMVHRDVKPHNLMLTPAGQVKILDFGLARFACEAASEGGVTATGMVLGTVDYIAPEQADNARAADIRADVYSLGCTLYHLLAGRPPFPTGSPIQKVMAHVEKTPQPLSELRNDLPEKLMPVLERMMAKNPSDRYQTPAEVAEALWPFTDQTAIICAPKARSLPRAFFDRSAVLDQRPRRRRTRAFVAAALALLLVGGGLLGLAVYRIQTDKGELVIQTENDDVEVVISVGGKLVKIIDTKTGKHVTLDSGDYELKLKDQPEGLKLSLDKVTLKRGDTVLVTIQRVDKPSAGKLGEVRELTFPGGKEQNVYYTAFSPDDRYLLASGDVWSVGTAVWETATRNFVTTVPVSAGAVFLPVNGHVLGAGKDGQLAVWDPITNKEVRHFEAHRSSGWPSLSADGTRAVSYGHAVGDPVVVWDVTTGKPIAEIPAGHDGLFLARLSPDGKRIVSAGAAGHTLRLWDVAQKKAIKTWVVKDRAVNGLIYFRPDGRSFVIATDTDRGILEFDDQADSPRCLREWRYTSAAGMSRDGRFALLSNGTTVYGFDVTDRKDLGQVALPTDVRGYIAVSADGRTGAAIGPGTSEVRGAPRIYLFRLGDPPPPEKVGEVRRFEGHTKGIIGISYSPDGRYALTTSYDLTVRMWDVKTGKQVRRFDGYTTWTYKAILSPDGRRVLTGGDDRAIRIWDAETGKELRRGEGHTEGIISVAVSPDSARALTCSWDKTIRLWNVETGEQLKVLEGHSDVVSGVTFSPDGKRALSWSNDKSVRLWDLESGKEIRQFVGHSEWVASAALSPDGRRAVSCGYDKSVRLWNVETGKEVRCFEGHTGHVRAVVFSPDGRSILSAATPANVDEEGDRSVRIWNVETGKELHRLDTGNVTNIALSPDGRYLLMASTWHPDVRLWRLPDLPAHKP